MSAPGGTAGHLSGSDRATRCPTEGGIPPWGSRILAQSKTGRSIFYRLTVSVRERIIIPAPEGTSKSIDAVKGKLSRSEFIRRAILHEIERGLTARLKRTKR